MSDTRLRKDLIRLAHENPELRPHLLPLIRGDKTGASNFVLTPEGKAMLGKVKRLLKNWTMVETPKVVLKKLWANPEYNFTWSVSVSGPPPWEDEADFNDFIPAFRRQQILDKYRASSFADLISKMEQARQSEIREAMGMARRVDSALPPGYDKVKDRPVRVSAEPVLKEDLNEVWINVPARPYSEVSY